jgi:hypothetical protein
LGFGFAARGALGGTALGLALRRGRRKVAALALWGGIGFLIGGFSNVLPFFVLEAGGIAFSTDIDGALGGAVLGALGGTALGLALRRGRRRVAALALFGVIGFLAGGFLGASLLAFLFFRSGGGMLQVASPGIALLDGALGGAALGLALRDGRKIIGLALAGALGFWIGSIIANYIHYWLGFGFLLTVIMFSLQGIIGGASLGAALGFLEKRME